MEKNIVFIVPSYKNAKWYEKNLASLCSQNYPNYHIIYTDDCSPDNTGDLVAKWITQNKQENKITLIQNKERVGALCNIYNMIHSCDDKDIVATVDGDDWLPHDRVLQRINTAYQDNNVWMTYGSYADSNGMHRGCCKPYEPNIIKNKLYRRVPWRASHLRTWYAKLFKKINKEDLFYQGNFMQMAWDVAINMPCLEMCNGKFDYIHDILYVYNNNNPISDHRVNQGLQAATDGFVRRKKPYDTVENLW